MTTRESNLEFELNFTQAVAEVIGTPRALTVSLLAKAGEWSQLLELTCDPLLYEDAGTFADDYLITELLQKSGHLPTGIDTKAVAVSAFYEAETNNALTNDRFSITDAVDHPDWWWRAKKYLRKVLGPVNRATLDAIDMRSAHGPGAVIGLKGSGIVPSSKYDMRPTCTEELLPLCAALPSGWADYRSLDGGPCVVEGNEFFTVPKNAKTDRGCAKGPLVNVYYQKGAGSYIVSRLRYFGVDLTDQSYNRFLAKMAWSWHLATIDLKQASDYMASVPLMQLLEDEWYSLLNLLRERVTKMPDGTKVPLQKFCAMGNGFTFALQSAVFLAVIRAIVPWDEHSVTSVFGDDIICPQRYAEEVCAALEYLGFRVNQSKSCLAGTFFESCGTDWFKGQNVRPFYLRRALPPEEEDGVDVSSQAGIPYQLQVANALRQWAQRRAAVGGQVGCDARFKPLWLKLVASVPAKWRNPVPLDFGDSGIITSYGDISMPLFPVKIVPLIGRTEFRGVAVEGWEGFALKHVALQPVRADKRTYGVLLAHLAGLPLHGDLSSEEPTLGQEPMRGLYGGAVARWSFHVGWTEGLDWVGPYA